MNELHVSEQVIMLKVMQNIKNTYEQLFPEKSTHRKAWVASLFVGCTAQEVKLHFPEWNLATISAALSSRFDMLGSDLLTRKNLAGTKRPKVSDMEKKITLELLKAELQQKSGCLRETYYYFDQDQVWDEYYLKFDAIATQARALSPSLSLRCPRSKKVLFCRILKDIKLCKLTQPHNCPICDDTKRAREELKRIKIELDVCHDPERTEELKSKVPQIQAIIAKGVLHEVRREHQRKWTQVRNQTHPNPISVIMNSHLIFNNNLINYTLYTDEARYS